MVFGMVKTCWTVETYWTAAVRRNGGGRAIRIRKYKKRMEARDVLNQKNKTGGVITKGGQLTKTNNQIKLCFNFLLILLRQVSNPQLRFISQLVHRMVHKFNILCILNATIFYIKYVLFWFRRWSSYTITMSKAT